MIVSIKQIGGHDGSAESRLAPAAQCGVEGVGAGAVRGAWGICSQGGDVAWREREDRARMAQARTRARRRRPVATKSHDLAGQDGRERAAVRAGVHGYLLANARSTCIKLLVHDGFGVWCAARRLNKGSFEWSICTAIGTTTGTATGTA
jgi:IS66 Orf2 like protein